MFTVQFPFDPQTKQIGAYLGTWCSVPFITPLASDGERLSDLFTPFQSELPCSLDSFPCCSAQAVNYPYVEDGTIGRSGTLTRSTHTQVVADSPGAVMKEHMLYIWNPEYEVRRPFRPRSLVRNDQTPFAREGERSIIQ